MMPPSVPNKQALNFNDLAKPNFSGQIQGKETSAPAPEANQRTGSERQQTPTSILPAATRAALTLITQSLAGQQPLTQLLAQANRQGLLSSRQDPTPNMTAVNISHSTAKAMDESATPESADDIISRLFQHGVNLSSGNKQSLGDALQKAITHYNTGVEKHEDETWQEQIEDLLESAENGEAELTDSEAELLELARKWLGRSEHNAFMQKIHLNAGQAVLLQDIPVQIQEQWQGIHLEIEQSSEQDPAVAEWKVLVQFAVDDVNISAKLTLNSRQEMHVYLWTDHPETTQHLAQERQRLSSSLYDLGLLVQPIFVANGKPAFGRTAEKPTPLAGSIDLTT